MQRKILLFMTVLMSLFSFTACKAEDSGLSISAVYGATAFLSLLLLSLYCLLVKKKEKWFIILFSAVAVINTCYFALSVSRTLQQALFANRVSYLGSVILPLSMLVIIMKTCNLKLSKKILYGLLLLGGVVFLIAASPGYLSIYYSEVSLIRENGVSSLDKEYGPLHIVYLFYLFGYFLSMVSIIFYARAKKTIRSGLYSTILASAVLINIGVWLMEQLVSFGFEFLSVSYILSELFLVLTSLLVEDERNHLIQQVSKAALAASAAEETRKDKRIFTSEECSEKLQYMKSRLETLTPSERQIYQKYLEGKGTKEILAELSIKENTLKYHNRNLYSKLGVTNRKELIAVAQSDVEE